MVKRLLPAYPLFVNDPYFSIWSNNEYLNKSDTIFWNGDIKKTYGLLKVDNEVYSFLGINENAIILDVEKVEVTLFKTIYYFSNPNFKFNISFISPLLITDLNLLSRPVCFFEYSFESNDKHDVEVLLSIDETYCYNKKNDYCIGGAFKFDNYELAFFGLNRQHPMSNSFDHVSNDSGYVYISGDISMYTYKQSLSNYISDGKLEYIMDEYPEKDETCIIALNKHNCSNSFKGKMMVGYYDLCSIFYFGEWLNGYYFKDGKTIFDAFEESYSNYDETIKKMDEFERKFDEDTKEFDEDYKLILYASYRQCLGAHKLVENKDGELLFLSKECHSNGCIATVDVTYPSMPLFLLYNSELATGMIRPILKFARMPVWNYDFAPHDAGKYPYCLGQTYGLKKYFENNKYNSNQFKLYRWNGIVVTNPFVYQYPKNSEPYALDSQMPVEESANLLLIAYSIIHFGGNDQFFKENYDLFKTWAEYLTSKELVPESQLCTDDFAPRVDENVNLSIKVIVALKAFSLLASKYNHNEDYIKANNRVNEYKTEFYNLFKTVNHLPLSYLTGEETFSLKYNMIFDTLYNFGLFEKETYDNEINYYLSHVNYMGVNLDSRSDLTKTDWALYASALTDDLSKSKMIYGGVANFLREGKDRVPFSDLYHTETGLIKDFQNRTVQGGTFILLLKHLEKEGKNVQL